MPFARPKTPIHSFRFRLAMWNAGIVVVSALATAFGLRLGVEYALIREVDNILLKDLREIELKFANSDFPRSTELFDFLTLKATAHNLDGWYVRVMDGNGDQMWASSGAPAKTPFSPNQRSWQPFPAGEMRIAQAQFQALRGDGKSYVIRIGTPMEPIQRDLRHVNGQVLLVALVVLIIAPLFGYALASQMTRPLTILNRSAEAMRPDQLHERVPIRGTGDELDQLSHTINRLLDRIAHHLDQKRDFLANAAHELRTPLAAIRSSVEVAMGRNWQASENNDLLAGLIEECESLELLVNQLLLLAESDADRLRLYNEPTSLSDIVRKTADMFEPVSEDHGVVTTMHVAPNIIVEGNPHNLRQVMSNLLDNAIKYTNRGGTIEVQLTANPETNLATIVIRDTGVGIKAEDVPRVFERFFRSDRSRQRDAGPRGTGLGLSICKAIIEAHGGTIALSSQFGVGTSVSINLPLAPPDVVGRYAKPAAPGKA